MAKMSFSFVVFVSVVFFCISNASASVIPKGNPEKFKVHITERGTKFVEKITIDEENDLYYFQTFHVPAHNGLTEADYLYDFQNDMSVSRVKSKASCYLGPLPENLPKPADLKAGFIQMASQAPASTNDVRKYWAVKEQVDKAVKEQVDKTLLRQEVQDFCGQFPVYLLQKVFLDSEDGLDNVDPGASRLAKRATDMSTIPFCSNLMFKEVGGCHPHDWIYSFKFRNEHGCTWWASCKFNFQRRTVCEEWQHLFNTLVCYKISCP